MLHKILFGLVFALCLQSLHADQTYEYGIVMDGGSTHTGLYIYRWPHRVSRNSTAPNSVPQQVTFTSQKPPISTCCNNYQAMAKYFMPLLSFAKTQLQSQSQYWGSYPIYIKATAGMRVLPEQQRVTIMGWIRAVLSNQTLNPFSFINDQAIIISGEEEGVFGWLSVNLLLNTLTTTPSTMPMYGALDMGGQSTQISFAALPSSDILEECTVMRMFGVNYRVYSHSFLTYGMNSMQSRVQQLLFNTQVPSSQINLTIYNPCLLVGYSDTVSVMNSSNQMVKVKEVGTGNVTSCGEFMEALFYENTACVTGSCSILGIYQPHYNLDNITFYAFSNYAFTLSDLDLSNTSTLAAIYEVANEICPLQWANFSNSTWGKLIWSKGLQSFAPSYCFQLLYIFNILHNAYGFPLENTNIIFTNGLVGSQLGWAQGSMLRDANWLPFGLVTTTTCGAESWHSQIYYGAFVWLCLIATYWNM